MTLDEMFPSKWMHGEDLPKRGMDATISEVGGEEMGFPPEFKNWLAFDEHDKKLIVNVTRGRRLFEMFPGSNGGKANSDDWVGKRVRLTPMLIQVGPEEKLTVKIDPPSSLKPTLKRKSASSEDEEINW
jgi:hypothetical protein